MTTLSKSLTAGGVGLGIAGSVATYQLTKSNSEESKQQVNTDEDNENASQDSLQPKAKEAPQEEHKAQAEQPSAPAQRGTSIADMRVSFFDRTIDNRHLEKEPIKFKPIKGKDRPDWISTSRNERGICKDDDGSRCEWSDFLKAKVPKGEKEKLRNSATNHAEKKCKEIKGKLSNDPENNQQGWTICTYSEGVESKTTGFYELNLDNEDLYQKDK
ncbi:hypothetical protein [Candidatus Mycoplasma haematohominis]|uniref:hypothetical protein n=1 Tax=Candidatus Mycoplasma haematohominis TaxID=1494318 RepID=UPI001C0A6E04|nr:hypothetical protein [Candidatus Mycoplasma haemohominis]